MLFVEADVVHGPNISIFRILVLNSVAFEAEVTVILLVWAAKINVDYTATAFDGPNGVAFSISKSTDRACGVF